jgi:hypothetical protein
MTKTTWKIPLYKAKRYTYDPEPGSLVRSANPMDAFNTPSYYDWRDQFVFSATLKFSQYHRGGHAVYLDWEDVDRPGVTFPMHMTDLVEAIPHIRNGQLDGAFTFSKKGSEFGVRLTVPMVNAPESFGLDFLHSMKPGQGLHFDRRVDSLEVGVYDARKHVTKAAWTFVVDEEEELDEAIAGAQEYLAGGQ